MLNNVKIEGERVYLRTITCDDTELICRWRNSKNVADYFLYRGEYTIEGQNKWVKEMVETGEVFQVLICLKENDKPVGCAYILHIDYENRKGEYGIYLGETDIRGMGISKEVLSLVKEYAFKEMKLHKLFSRIIDTNEPSLRHVKACGFEEEGVLRDTLFIDGQYINVVILSVLNPEV